MASQESREIQISLHTTLSALSLYHDLGIPDDISSLTSDFTTPSDSRHNSPTLTENNFTLHLAYWAQFSQTPLLFHNDGHIKVGKIFERFIDAV